MKTIIKSTRLLLSILVALTLTMILGANGAKANAQQVVFLVQYAEVAVGEDALTEGGQRRAKARPVGMALRRSRLASLPSSS